eukprot:SAG31_NODE_1333_length_8743_cov_1.681050_4_plen_92_part_00
MEGRDSCSGRVLSATKFKFSTSSYVVGKALRGKDTFSCVLNFINSFQLKFRTSYLQLYMYMYLCRHVAKFRSTPISNEDGALRDTNITITY